MSILIYQQPTCLRHCSFRVTYALLSFVNWLVPWLIFPLWTAWRCENSFVWTTHRARSIAWRKAGWVSCEKGKNAELRTVAALSLEWNSKQQTLITSDQGSCARETSHIPGKGYFQGSAWTSFRQKMIIPTCRLVSEVLIKPCIFFSLFLLL